MSIKHFNYIVNKNSVVTTQKLKEKNLYLRRFNKNASNN